MFEHYVKYFILCTPSVKVPKHLKRLTNLHKIMVEVKNGVKH